MRLYLLKLKDKPLYFAAKLARAVLSDIEYLLHPEKRKKKHTHYDLQKHLSGTKEYLTHPIPACWRSIRQIENIAAYLEKIHFNTRIHRARHDEHIRSSLFLLHEALELIYKDLTALKKRPISPDIKLIAAHAGKNLRLARRQAAVDGADFIENLKCDSIYDSLGKCFDCLDAYFDERQKFL